jgi:hypothetical protein
MFTCDFLLRWSLPLIQSLSIAWFLGLDRTDYNVFIVCSAVAVFRVLSNLNWLRGFTMRFKSSGFEWPRPQSENISTVLSQTCPRPGRTMTRQSTFHWYWCGHVLIGLITWTRNTDHQWTDCHHQAAWHNFKDGINDAETWRRQMRIVHQSICQRR